MKRDPQSFQDNKEFFIPIKGTRVPVTEAVYRAYMRPIWREKKNAPVRDDKERSLEVLREFGLELPDEGPLIEEIVEDRMMLDVLFNALSRLSAEERALVQALFFDGKSERALADEAGVPYTTINYRKIRLLEKLRKFF